MAKQKKAEFDLFQAPPSAARPAPPRQPAPSLDLFARPPEKPAPGRVPSPAPQRAPAAPSLDLFARPPGEAPRAPEPPPAAPQPPPSPEPGVNLFDRPPSAEAPPAPAPEPAPAPPRAPTPAPAAPPRPAPSGDPGRPAPHGDQTQALRRTQDFKQFLRENYEAGQAQIQHPDPQKRRRNPTIKFWTAMKYPTFKRKVKQEFERWREEEEARRPRVQPGDRIQSLDELRAGDIIGRSWGTKYKVIRKSPRSVVLKEVDEFGRFKNDRTKRRNLNQMRTNRWQRHEDLKRPDVSYEKAKAYIDENHGFPPRDVTSKTQYKEWLKKKFTEGRRSPYRRLGDDEAQHQQALEQQLEQLLEERGVGEDWSWTPPPPVQIGQRIQNPLQVEAGDFVGYAHRKYRVIDSNDEEIKAVRVDDNGRPQRGTVEIKKYDLKNSPYKRIEPIQRPDVPLDQAKTFAAANLLVPPRNVNSRTKYKEWLEKGFKETRNSPYQGLGDDELEHQRALEKQIKKILDERGVGPDWEWEAPEPPAIGSRYQDPYQMQPGQFVQNTYGKKFKVLEVDDDGRVKVIGVDNNGRPIDGPTTLSRTRTREGAYTRIDEVKRPEVSDRKAKSWAEGYAANPRRFVTNREQYKKWLFGQFKSNPESPYYQLGDDESSHKEKLEQQIEKILDARGIDSDWVWTPPPPITFEVAPDWEAKHQQILDVARQGEKTSDRHLGGGVNAARKRKLKLGDDERTFVFKSKANERALGNKTGVPGGKLHNREQAAYELDLLLGPGTVVPVTTSAGQGGDQGAYQVWVDGFDTFSNSGQNLSRISTKDLLRHQDVGRLLVMDALMGHQDRHGGNIGFSWVDPRGPKTANNLRIHAIDNGYALARTKSRQSVGSWDIRDAWALSGGSDRRHLIMDYFEAVPDDMKERLRKVSTDDVAEALIKSGIKDPSVLESVAVRLAVLKDNPEALHSYISRGGSIYGQQKFQYDSHHDPAKMLRDHTDLDESSTLSEIKETVAKALRDA